MIKNNLTTVINVRLYGLMLANYFVRVSMKRAKRFTGSHKYKEYSFRREIRVIKFYFLQSLLLLRIFWETQNREYVLSFFFLFQYVNHNVKCLGHLMI